MRLHYLQHASFEDAANIGVWAAENGHHVTHTRCDLGETLPDPAAIDWLVIMGGPMNVDEHNLYPWLVAEKEFIRRVINRGMPVLGVCLGGQLLSAVLGGRVTRNRQKEIGWYPVKFTEAGVASAIFAPFAGKELPAFHWHGDTFSIPPGAIHLAGSLGCDNQAFQYGRNVVALQFHWDYSQESVQTMIQHCGNELVDAPGIQRPKEMLATPARFLETKSLLYQLLDAMAKSG